MVFKHKVKVEFEDVDYYKITHHTKLIAYLERARVALILSHGLTREDMLNSVGLVLTKMEIKFKNPGRLWDELTVELSVKKLGLVKSSLWLK